VATATHEIFIFNPHDENKSCKLRSNLKIKLEYPPDLKNAKYNFLSGTYK
jgi:hypothetical protein